MPLIQGITHRGIAGSDYTDCSFFFLYALCQVRLWWCCGRIFAELDACSYFWHTYERIVLSVCIPIPSQVAVRSNIVKLLGFAKTSKYDTPASPFGVAPPS